MTTFLTLIFRRHVTLLAAGLLMSTAASTPSYAQPAVLVGQDNWLFYAQEDIRSAGTNAIDQSVSLFRHAQDALAKRSINLVMAIPPMKARFYKSRLPSGSAISSQAEGRYSYIISAMQKEGIKTLNLIPVLQSVEQSEGQTVFLQKDSHWTAWSAEASALAFAQLILENWTLPGSPGSGDKLGGWTKERRFGDFAQLMTAEERRTIGQQIYVVRTGTTSGTGLIDSAKTPVHIIGNSFVQPYLGFPQAVSAAIDRPVGLTWKYGNFGPWAVFLDYLKSDDFQHNPPQVIIWEINESQLLYGPDTAGQWDASSLMSEQAWRNNITTVIGR